MPVRSRGEGPVIQEDESRFGLAPNRPARQDFTIKIRFQFSRWSRRLALTTAMFLFGLASLRSATLEIPEYAIGDKATGDIVTPIPLVVFDPARTEELRRAEGRKVSPVIRHVPNERAHADQNLRAAFAEVRERFAHEIERAFQHRPPLLSSELAQPGFNELVQGFAKRHPAFPLSRQLVELWALGDGGDLILDSLAQTLRRWNERLLLGEELPRHERSITGNVRLVAADSRSAVLTSAQMDKGRSLSRTNLATLESVRRQASKQAATETNSVHFVLSFLRPNCFFEPEITRQARARRVESINAADRYAAGSRIVAGGEIISRPVKLALDELRVRTEAERLEADAARERLLATAEAARAKEAAARAAMAGQTNRWLIAGLAAAGLVCAILGVLLWSRHRHSRTLLSVAAAEARAEEAARLLRAQMLPHLARSMVTEMFQRLWTQRAVSQSAQAQAQSEVAELARRLEELQAPLQDRLHAYEQRIVELETELAFKGQENQALIQAKIETTRKMLEGERNQDRISA